MCVPFYLYKFRNIFCEKKQLICAYFIKDLVGMHIIVKYIANDPLLNATLLVNEVLIYLEHQCSDSVMYIIPWLLFFIQYVGSN